ncbi:thioesterase, partial [Cereibacter sphaeroides]
ISTGAFTVERARAAAGDPARATAAVAGAAVAGRAVE